MSRSDVAIFNRTFLSSRHGFIIPQRERLKYF